jgi:pseudoazurin
MKLISKMLLSLVFSASLGSMAHAAEVTVEMLNNKDGQLYAFSQNLIKVAKGDTIIWKASNAGHNAQFVAKAFPEGAAPMEGVIGKDVNYTFTVPGTYVVKCNPHFGMGMVAVVVVDNNISNLEALKTLTYPGKAKTATDTIFADLAKK